MSVDKQQVHRAGAFKQTNKAHSHGRHRSKGSISSYNKGKVNVKDLSKKKTIALKKEQRRHQALQLRRNKRDEALSKKRMLGGFEEAPFLVCVIPLNEFINVPSALETITNCDAEAKVQHSLSGVMHITIPRFKQQFSFVCPPIDNYLAALDTLKVCNTVVFLISAKAGIEFGDELVDKYGRKILASGFAQGLPTPIIAVTDLDDMPTKKQNLQKQNIQKVMEKWLPDEKLLTLSKNSDGLNLLRKIGDKKQKPILYRDRRPHIYADSYEYEPDSEGFKGTLKISGFLRGTSLSVNRLVYISGLGAYQMSKIEAPNNPFFPENKNKDAMETGNSVRLLATADQNRIESLVTENEPDPMEGEQTWPTEEEIKTAQQENKKVKKVPKGWSEYQAAWIPDEDAEDISDDEEDSDDAMDDGVSEEKSDAEQEEEYDTMTESEVGVNEQQYDQQMDMAAEKRDLEKIKAAKMDQMFPDEIDTPHDMPARERFQKYRGLESFRTSPWDPKENLPLDYARIFQFENFDRTKRRIIKEQESETHDASAGWFVTVYVTGITKQSWNAFESTGSPVVLMGLYPHENKMSVLNVVLKRTGNYDQPIASKEKLIFQCGYRRFIVNPIFSQHTNGKKHKYERFFQPESTVVATFFAPIQFPPAPVLCFKELHSGLELVATGNLLSCNPDRIVVKRIVLSGHPIRVQKRSSVIRFMFFNRDDIAYYKPCKLRTKSGRIGHIKEALGTHGHMKCVFDGQLKSQDTVLLNLFKRVFPKWTYEECLVSYEDNENMEG